MFWAGSSVREWIIAFLVVSAIGVFTTSILKAAGWSWWARFMLVIPVIAVAARIASRLISNTTFIFLH